MQGAGWLAKSLRNWMWNDRHLGVVYCRKQPYLIGCFNLYGLWQRMDSVSFRQGNSRELNRNGPLWILINLKTSFWSLRCWTTAHIHEVGRETVSCPRTLQPSRCLHGRDLQKKNKHPIGCKQSFPIRRSGLLPPAKGKLYSCWVQLGIQLTWKVQKCFAGYCFFLFFFSFCLFQTGHVLFVIHEPARWMD